jgi:hypothetical protein
MLIGLTLTILLMFSLFSIVLGAEWGQDVVNASDSTSAAVNGTTTGLSYNADNVFLDIGVLNGALVILTVVIALAILFGIRILDSGLSDSSVRTITTAVLYGSIWISLSLLAYSGIIMIEVFGALIYVVLTFLYVIGVVQKINEV